MSCGQGYQSRVVKCYSDSHELLPNENCDSANKPEVKQNCTKICKENFDYHWKTISYGEVNQI